MIVFKDEKKLLEVLAEVTGRLDKLGEKRILVGESPNKFNDANEDDHWYAVQAGGTFWEQSHFFRYDNVAEVSERSTYSLETSKEERTETGLIAESEIVGLLRDQLKYLHRSRWRELCGWDHLTSLVFELDRWWLVLERPPSLDGEIFTWDSDGMFHVGTMERIDQTVGSPGSLLFKIVSNKNLGRLNGNSYTYFFPQISDENAHKQLLQIFKEVTHEVLQATHETVCLKSDKSRAYYSTERYFDPETRSPTIYSYALRPKEGELRKPTNGKWPGFWNGLTKTGREYSDVAKSLHIALAKLEDYKWRELFGRAFGEKLLFGQTLALFVDPENAILVRDNTAFLVQPNGLHILGVVDYPSCNSPEDFLLNTCKKFRLYPATEIYDL